MSYALNHEPFAAPAAFATTDVGVNVGVNVATNRALLAPEESSSGPAKAARWLVIDQ